MRSSHRRNRILLFLVPLLVLGACGGGTQSETTEAQTETTVGEPDVLRIGYIPITGMVSLWAGMDQGYFDEAGIELETVDLPGGPQLFSALEGGSLNVAWTGYTTFFVTVSQGFDMVLVAGSIRENATPTDDGFTEKGVNGIMVLEDSGIETAQDLEGKRVAVNALSNIIELYTRNWVDLHGGDSDLVEYVAVPYPQMGDALRSGRVDAVNHTEPFLTLELEAGGVNEIGTAFGDVSPTLQAGGWYAQGAFAEENADLLERFVQALHRGAEYANAASAEEKAAIVANHSQIAPELLANVRWWTFEEGAVDVEELQREADRTLEYGLMDNPIVVADAVFPTALEN